MSKKQKITEVKGRRNKILGIVVFLVAFGIASTIVENLIAPHPVQNVANYFNRTGWKDFTATTGNFKMQFPIYPSEKTETLKATNITPILPYTIYEADTSNGSYLAGVVTYPDTVDISNPQVTLNNVVNGAVAATKGNIISSNFTMFQGYTAVDYVIQVNNVYVKYRSFLVRQTLYSLGTTSTTNDFPDFDRFVNSFQLL